MSKFFSYDPDGDGLTFHETEELAKAAADIALDYYRANAPDFGWDDSVRLVCWGSVTECAARTSEKKRPPDDELDGGFDSDGTYWGEWDEIATYDLRPVDDNNSST